MELKAGYKQTGVAMIPEDWEFEELAEIAEVIDGDRGDNYPGANDYSENGYCLFLSAENVTRDGFKFFSCSFISKEKDLSLNMGKLKTNDIVLTTRGTVGNLAFFDKSVIFENIRINSGMVILRNRVRRVIPQYLYIIMRSRIVGIQIAKAIFGSAQPQLTVHAINKFKIPLPSFAEQAAIIPAVYDVDALITALDRLIAKKRNIKQAAMQELLTGKRRLPGFSGEWEVKKIGDFTDCSAGGTPSTLVATYWGGEIRWMNSGELHMKFVNEVEGRITPEGFTNSSTKLIPPNCVLVGLAGQGKTRGTVAINLVKLCINQSIAAIYPSSEYVSEYLYYNLDSRYDELRSLSSGEGGRGGLNLAIIKSISVPLPMRPEQEAIATVLSDMDAEIAALESRRKKTHALKQGMMQELLTGRIRLVEGATA